MSEIHLNTRELPLEIPRLNAGDSLLLSGTVYTARDAAHARLIQLLQQGEPLPFPLAGASVYYAGPTEAPPGRAIGSCGPTTSCRMDSFTPTLLDAGLCCMIGKGERSRAVIDSIIKNHAIYLCAIGGAGALAAKCITSCEVIAFPELGCESIKRLHFERFPLIVGIDCKGNSVFAR